MQEKHVSKPKILTCQNSKKNSIFNTISLPLKEMADASKSKIDKKAASKRSYKCVVPSCGYFAPSGFFSFPSKDEAMKKVWLDKLDLAKVDKNSLLCAQYFHSDHITPKSLNTQRPRLKIGAVPSRR